MTLAERPSPPASAVKTRITALLDAHGIAYRVVPYREPVFTTETLVEEYGLAKERLVKSILLKEKDSGRFVMACVTGDARIDLQAVRDSLSVGWRRLSFANDREVRQVTGYVRGTVSPLCLPSRIPVVFDEAIGRCERVNISSGDPAAGLELEACDLVRVASARSASIAQAPTQAGSAKE